jgi:hypothetical protein
MASPAAKTDPDGEEFTEKRGRKRNNSSEEGGTRSVQIHIWSKEGEGAVATNSLAIPIRKYFAPLRLDEDDTVYTGENGAQQVSTSVPKAAGRPPPVIVTMSLNLLKFQGELKSIMKGTFEFRTTRNGIKVVTKGMADYLALIRHLDANTIPYCTFDPKSVKPVKAVIFHLPGDTPAKDISDELVALGFSVISVRQMTVTRPEAEGSLQTHNIPLFLVTLALNEKAAEIFKLTNIGHIIMRGEAYKSQDGMTQCFKCQRFGQVWINSKQPPIVCGVGRSLPLRLS